MAPRNYLYSLTLSRGLVTGLSMGPILLTDLPALPSHTPLWERLWELFDANSPPVDALVEDGVWKLLAFFTSHDAATWTGATNARYVVPASKKLLVCQVMTAGVMTDSDTDARLQNLTDSSTVLENDQKAGSYVPWSGVPPALPEVAAGKIVRLEVFNADTTERAAGMAVLCREVDA